ncbi:MAG: hypothetical protein ACRD3M_17535 [Thermoanaerobaculia bacterium]
MSRLSRRAGLTLLLALALAACGRQKSDGQRSLPSGDGVWLSAGLSGGEPEAQEILRRGAFARVFLPAVRLLAEGGVWKTAASPLPPTPVTAVPVVFVVESDGDFEAAFLPGAEETVAAAIGDGLSRALQRRGQFGRVEGVHLDLPFRAEATEAFGALATRLRARLPGDLFLTATLGFVPPKKERKDFVQRLASLDGFVAFVYGIGAGTDPIAADALGKPWWAGYRSGARGEGSGASETPRAGLTERFLEGLTESGEVSLEHDLALRQEGVSGFVFRPSAAVTIDGARFEAGDRIAFAQPSVSELLYRFGADLAGRRLVRGRLVALDGSAESERVFTMAALSDVLLGRPLLPDLRVSLRAEEAGLRLAAENFSTHASVVSRTVNWVEVDLPSGQISDVQPGGFDRYEVFDAEGRPVTPGRATRVRFFETLIAPREQIEDAVILLRGRPAAEGHRFRQHVLAASGTELAGDWMSPPPEPTPTPEPKPKARRKRR